jgi:hypothetical protein
MSQARNQLEAEFWQHVHLKRPLTFNGQQGVMSQKIKLFRKRVLSNINTNSNEESLPVLK